MKITKNRSLATVLSAVSIAIAVSGCTVNLGTAGSGNNHGMMGNGGMMGNENANNSTFSGADIMFAQMMIPHHQQAIEMSTLAETHTQNPVLLALAKQIKDAQTPEIAQMESWLKVANADLEMNHSMGMGGMLSTTDMANLGAATGATFDKLYLTGMIGHHEGAIHMAQMVIDSNNTEARTLGENVVRSQTAEITYMKTLLAKVS